MLSPGRANEGCLYRTSSLSPNCRWRFHLQKTKVTVTDALGRAVVESKLMLEISHLKEPQPTEVLALKALAIPPEAHLWQLVALESHQDQLATAHLLSQMEPALMPAGPNTLPPDAWGHLLSH